MLEIRHDQVGKELSIRAAYDHFYQERDLQMRDSFYLWLIELLRPEPGSFLLDIACGQGRLVQLASERGIAAAGADLSLGGLLKGAQDASRARWLVADGEVLPLPDDSVDYIMHIGSLEHYGHPLQGVREMVRVLSPRGRACILLPNAFGLMGNIRHVWRKGEIFDDGQPLQRYGTRRTWEVLLESGGFCIERLVPWGEVNFPRTPQDWRWSLARPQKLVRALIAALTPVNLANHFVFICRPGPIPAAPAPYPMLPASS